MGQWLRVNLNGRSVSKIASILSNTVLLAANTYLLTSNIKNSMAESKRKKVVDNLQLTAEVASAVKGLTQVVTDISEKNHAQNSEDL